MYFTSTSESMLKARQHFGARGSKTLSVSASCQTTPQSLFRDLARAEKKIVSYDYVQKGNMQCCNYSCASMSDFAEYAAVILIQTSVASPVNGVDWKL